MFSQLGFARTNALTQTHHFLIPFSEAVSEDWKSAVGIALALVGSVGINTGNNFQSLGMHRLEIATIKRMTFAGATAAELADVKTKASESIMWRWGTAAFILGSLMNFASFAFAPSVVVAAIEAVQFVSNIIFGKFLLKKQITKRMYVGTILIVVAVLVIVLTVELAVAAEAGEHELWTVQILMDNYVTNIAFIVYFICMLVFAAGLYPLNVWLRKKNMANKATGVATWTDTAEPIVYAVFSGIFGSQAVVQAKALAICIENVAFDQYFLFVTLVLWLVFVIVWIFRLNGGLKRYNPLFIIPLLHCNFIVLAIISGGIFFREFDALTEAWQWACFLAGMFSMVFGLYLVRPGAEPIAPFDEDGEGFNGDTVPIKGESDDVEPYYYPAKGVEVETEKEDSDVSSRPRGFQLQVSPPAKKDPKYFSKEAFTSGALLMSSGPSLMTKGVLNEWTRRASASQDKRRASVSNDAAILAARGSDLRRYSAASSDSNSTPDRKFGCNAAARASGGYGHTFSNHLDDDMSIDEADAEEAEASA
jgi:uncharacterized membrane protein